jgi:geranylgeranyl pyrophosphate synthase
LELSQIYAPVEDGLRQVEARLTLSATVDFPHLAALLEHSLRSDGKRIRPALTLLSGKVYNENTESVIAMAAALEILHTATLVHDDAIDHSDVRRSKPTINKLWGEEQAVLLGDYLFAEAGSLTATTNNLRVVKLFASTLKTISMGELDQAASAFDLHQSQDEYFRRIARKTATLFTTSTESGAALSGAPEESVQRLVEYGHNLGICFQIVDDLLDFVGTEKQLGKPIGSDISQGTVTLPLLVLVSRYPAEECVRRLFVNRSDPANNGAVIEMVRNSSTVIKECYDIASGFCERAVCALRGLPANEACGSLSELASYIMRRDK